MIKNKWKEIKTSLYGENANKLCDMLGFTQDGEKKRMKKTLLEITYRSIEGRTVLELLILTKDEYEHQSTRWEQLTDIEQQNGALMT